MVARDPASGELGVAVQSHWFSVGSVVTWGRPGVGAVATQSMAEPAYGPRLLDRLAAGEPPAAALEAEIGSDDGARLRQVAVVGAGGEAVAFTGDGCIPFAGDVQGDGYSAQANLMASADVWPAMASAFEAAAGPLSRRLLAALEAGEAAGGDVRGRQSAALLVVPAEGEAWRRVVELRVEDHPEPLAELGRVLTLHEAYELATEAENLGAEGRHEEAGVAGRRALELAPDNDELTFWAGLALVHQGQADLGLALIRQAIEIHPGWRELLGRLSTDLAPGAAEARRALGAAGEAEPRTP
jgi:uncharacterized Ntn-hydrolase superfamily protein